MKIKRGEKMRHFDMDQNILIHNNSVMLQCPLVYDNIMHETERCGRIVNFMSI